MRNGTQAQVSPPTSDKQREWDARQRPGPDPTPYDERKLGTCSFALASAGRLARRRRRTWRFPGGWAVSHITGMGGSYIVLLTAFYVDNGKNLPLWRDLPHSTYWLLPSAVGIPIVVRALRRHRRLPARQLEQP
jgi:hypothetical protein